MGLWEGTAMEDHRRSPSGRAADSMVASGARPMRGAACILDTLLVLNGCGFRLAGGEPLPTVLARPYLSFKDPYTDFSRELEHQLKSSGAALQPLRESASATIEVTKDLVEQRTLAVKGTATAIQTANIPTEYELTYTVIFAVDRADKQLLAPQTITVSKDYSFDDRVLLAKSHEADALREQMARDLVSIAMHRLTNLK